MFTSGNKRKIADQIDVIVGIAEERAEEIARLDRVLLLAADVDAIEAALLDAHDMDVTLKDYAQAVSRYIMGLVDREGG